MSIKLIGSFYPEYSHDVIYLIDCDGEMAWCQDPAPGADQSAGEAIEYVRSDIVRELQERLRTADENVKRLTHERKCLAEAIGEVAVACGDIRTDFTGPDLLMVCRDVGEALQRMSQQIEASQRQERTWFAEGDLYKDRQSAVAAISAAGNSYPPMELFNGPVISLPLGYVDGNYNYQFSNFGHARIDSKASDFASIPVYASPVVAPALQDTERLDFMLRKEAYIGWGRDGEKCAVYSNDPDEENTLNRLNGSKCFNDPRDAIDHAISAQPHSEDKP